MILVWELELGGHHSQYEDADAVNYHHAPSFRADVLFPHIKFLEGEKNEYDCTKDSVCDKIIKRTGIHVPWCIDMS